MNQRSPPFRQLVDKPDRAVGAQRILEEGASNLLASHPGADHQSLMAPLSALAPALSHPQAQSVAHPTEHEEDDRPVDDEDRARKGLQADEEGQSGADHPAQGDGFE